MWKRLGLSLVLALVLMSLFAEAALADLSFEQGLTDWTIEQRDDEFITTVNQHDAQVVTNRYSQGVESARLSARVVGDQSYWGYDDWTDTIAWENGPLDLRNALYIWVDMTDILSQTSHYGWGYGMQIDLVVSDGVHESRRMLWNHHQEPYGPSGDLDNLCYQTVTGADGTQWYRYRASLTDATQWSGGQYTDGLSGPSPNIGPLANVNLASARVGISVNVRSWYDYRNPPQDLWCNGLVDNLRIEYPPPDLAVSSFTHSPENPTVFDEITFTAMVENIGAGPAVPSTLSIRVGGEGTPPTYAVPFLNPGASFTATRTVTLSHAQNYINAATADVNNQLAESDETNNSVIHSVRVNKATATITLSGLTQTYTGSALTPTAITNPPGLAFSWTGAPQTNAGSYPVTAAINDAHYQGSVTGTFIITQKTASVMPNAAGKVYGAADPALSGTLTGFLEGDGVSATYSRSAGENVGTYTISAVLGPAGVLANYNTTYNKAIFTINYGFKGLLPLYTTPPSNFNTGRSIPLKWQYTDSSRNAVNSSTAAPSITITLNGSSIPIGDPGKSGLLYDAITNTWQFNWQTKGLVAGTYQIWINSTQTGQRNGPFTIQLR